MHKRYFKNYIQSEVEGYATCPNMQSRRTSQPRTEDPTADFAASL